MQPLNRYLIMSRHLDRGEGPREAIATVSSRASTGRRGSLALAADPIPGLARWLEPEHDLSSGILVVKMDLDEAEVFAEHFSDLMLEKETYLPHADQDLGCEQLGEPDTLLRGFPVTLQVVDVEDRPVCGVRVVQKAPGIMMPFGAQTNAQGVVTLRVVRPDSVVEVHPSHSYWPARVGGFEPDSLRTRKVILQTLEPPRGYNWDHREMGLSEGTRSRIEPRPQPVAVGIVDTGICEHPNLPPGITGKNFVEYESEHSWREDPRCHGSFMAGIIAAQGAAGEMIGYAPDAKFHVYKVFPATPGRASTVDVARAITQAADDEVEVLCIALSAREPLMAVHRALEYAGQKGVLCCVASGNDGCEVGWPAACCLPNVLSIGAFGRIDVVRSGTTFEHVISNYTSRGFFHAAFSNRGTSDGARKVDAIAPGVGCVSTVPGGYTVSQGTSIAAAHVTGLIAAVLESRPDLRFEVSKEKKAETILAFLPRLYETFGWGPMREGKGRPSLARLLSAARTM